MSGRIILAASAVALGLAAAAGAAPRATKRTPPTAKAPSSEVAKLVQSCDAHKFETVVHEVVDGQPHQSKVKLCGKQGQSDADWLVTLKDAVAKVSANADMAKEVRAQIVTALNAEIDRLEHPVNPLLPTRKSADKSILDGLSPLPALPQGQQAQAAPLPPMPTVSQPPAASMPPPRQVAQTAPREDYAALPPLPATPPAPVRVLAGGVGASVPMLPKPRMNLTCYTPGETNDGPCTGFTRQTLVTVHAQEDLPAGTAVRFVRDGDPKADVELAQLKKGRAMQFALPTDVCRHVVGGRLELRIVRSGQEVDSDGPYNLNC